MANILLIETSGLTCGVALCVNGELEKVFSTSDGTMLHAQYLPVHSDEILKYMRKNSIKLDAVAISAGPGSYTGLRIGTSTAKGICYALEAKLIAINTLKLIAASATQKIELNEDFQIAPMIDARRMEVYTALYSPKLEEIIPASAVIVESDSFDNILSKPTYFCGNGAEKCKESIISENARWIDNINPTVEDMNILAIEAYNNNKFEDVAYYEPFYLKEFQATTPKKNI